MRYGSRARVGQAVASWMTHGSLKSLQSGSTTITAPSSDTTITAVDLANSFMLLLGTDNTDVTGTYHSVAVALTSATTVTAYLTTTNAANAAFWMVLEFYPGLIKLRQQTTISLNGVTTANGTIATVNTAKTVIIPNGMTSNSGAANLAQDTVKWVLTNATTLTASRGAAGVETLLAYATAVEFY